MEENKKVMTEFTPSLHNFQRLLISKIEWFVKTAEGLTDEQRTNLKYQVSGWVYNKQGFDAKTIVEDAFGYAISEWVQQNHELSELWKQVAVANAAIHNAPEETATVVVAKYKEGFNIT
jgi:hypothetical protein